uniref:Uncharacterized protein n=1 Tax=Panagrolaimus superbus TaxID=310955 RepID=A0A914YZM7_9BILA
MNNSFQVKKEGSTGGNDSLEALNLTMQRMELNVLKVVGTLSDRVNTMENKLDSLLINVNNLERNTSNTLASTVNGLASHLEKSHVANYEKQLSHIAEVQALSQIITALRQNPNAFGPMSGVPVMQQQQLQQQQQQSFRPVHPNLQAAPSIPQNIAPPQHLPMEQPKLAANPHGPAQVPTEPKPFSVIKPPVAPEFADKKDNEQGLKQQQQNPFTANTGNFSFGTGHPQKPLFPGKPVAPTPAAAVAETPVQQQPIAETKSIFGNTKPPTFSFANQSAAATTSPFAVPSNQAQGVNQNKPLFGSPFANTPGNKPLSFTPTANAAGNNSPSVC